MLEGLPNELLPKASPVLGHITLHTAPLMLPTRLTDSTPLPVRKNWLPVRTAALAWAFLMFGKLVSLPGPTIQAAAAQKQLLRQVEVTDSFQS